MYRDLIQDPIEQLRRIYAASGICFTENIENNAKSLINREKKDRFGKHIYRLHDFGLDQREINSRCEFYCLEYDLSHEN